MDQELANLLGDINDLPDSLKDILNSSDEEVIELKEETLKESESKPDQENKVNNLLDKSEESATVNTEENKESKVSEFDAYLDSLSTDRERSEAKYAASKNWDFKRYINGEGWSAETHNAREPLIKNLKAQQDKIDKLERIVSSTETKRLSYTKRQAEELIKKAELRMQQAEEDEDYRELKSAYSELTEAKNILEEAENQLKVFDEPVHTVKDPEWMTDDWKHNATVAGKDFMYRNKDWFFEFSPSYDPEKAAKAVLLEKDIINNNPGIDPQLLYVRLQVEIEKLNSKQSNTSDTIKDVSKAPAARNPALESVSAVRSADHRSSDYANLSEGDRLIMSVLNDSDMKAYNINVDDYKKMKGIK